MNSGQGELAFKIYYWLSAFAFLFLGMSISACLSQRNYDLIHYPCPRSYDYEVDLYEKTHNWDFKERDLQNEQTEGEEERGLDDSLSTSVQ